MPDKERIIIFSMEKVGSSTVKWALEHAGYLVDRVTPHNAEAFLVDLVSLKVITMIRDPFAYFNSIAAEYRKFPPIHTHKTFMTKYITQRTGIDPFKYYFDKKQGWQIYNERLLIIRTESLTNRLDWALSEFLGPDDYLIDHRARGIERFGPDYLKGVEGSWLDQELLGRVYNQPYMQHFYTPKELQEFKQRWAMK